MSDSSSVKFSAWNGHKFNPPIIITLPPGLTSPELWSLLPGAASNKVPACKFPALQNWLTRLLDNFALQSHANHPFHKHPFKLREVHIQDIVRFNKEKIGFMKLSAKIETDAYVHDTEEQARPDWLPGNIFLRGSSVAMLIIVQPEECTDEHEKHVIFTIQPRPAAGSLAFLEIPAGMVEEGSFIGAAARELKEEVGLEIKEDELLDMTELALQDDSKSKDNEHEDDVKSVANDTFNLAMYPSPGACDEYIPLMLCQKRISRRRMDELKGKATGLRHEGEYITLKLVPLHQAWRSGARDAKTLAALTLYNGLKSEGKLPDMPSVETKEAGKDMESDEKGSAKGKKDGSRKRETSKSGEKGGKKAKAEKQKGETKNDGLERALAVDNAQTDTDAVLERTLETNDMQADADDTVDSTKTNDRNNLVAMQEYK